MHDVAHFQTAFGPLRASAGPDGLFELAFLTDGLQPDTEAGGHGHPVLHAFEFWLRAYEAGDFDKLPALPLAPSGTDFEREVWQAVTTVRAGDLATYGDIAVLVGRRGAARAVGRAVGRCPLALVVPCHRVIGAGGRLAGFGGALSLKRLLLQHEGFCVPAARPDCRITRRVLPHPG